jgi:glycosyltransferase involved in cell wall biosynthesis
LAIEVAKRAGIPLKIAGEVQPMFQEYFDTQIKPHLDNGNIEYVGEADVALKNELLGSSLGLLFPIQWDEPFGLVMIESMACGSPVYALPGGSVAEVVKDGVTGYTCASIGDMAERVRTAREFDFSQVRPAVLKEFSLQKMVQSYAELYMEIAGATAVPRDLEDLDEHRAVA